MQNPNKGLRILALSLGFGKLFSGRGAVSQHSHPSNDLPGLNLKTMDGAKWSGHLNSLEILKISCFSALQYFPDSGLPSSLKILEIRYCYALQWVVLKVDYPLLLRFWRFRIALCCSACQKMGYPFLLVKYISLDVTC
ncbi:hypothetical protein RchiOBHm_Chr1g0340451 [Rosa chinensis]|uniref:Uncharacterized protein n=1 Tax=Rosa chinensis TaxID=74649 RepID=A0A2P6SDI9_ROSCH|nr:hypothetical protein RchiOBHm_Chr1g0340451 [Rosa chinensis]